MISLVMIIAAKSRKEGIIMVSGKTYPDLRRRMFELGLVTYNLGKDWNIDTLISNCLKTGFRAIELRTTHEHGVEPFLGRDDRIGIGRRFADSPVRLLSLGTTCEFHSTEKNVVHENINEAKKFIELAHDIGALGIKVRPNGIPEGVPESKTIEQIGTALKECGQYGERYGVEIWLEVHGKQSNVPSLVKKMMESADHPLVGVCWNSNPEDIKKKSVEGSFFLLEPWLRNVHIRELWDQNYPYQELFKLLKKFEYNRYTLAEIPSSPDPIRLMHYYHALWEALTS